MDRLETQEPRRIPLTPRFVANLLLVKFKSGTSPQRQAEILERAGADVERRIARLGVVVVEMPPARRAQVLAKLRASPAVGRAEKDAVFERLDTTPNDAIWSQQWGLRQVGLPSAWDRTRGLAGTVVAVLDTGVDANHPDLRGAVLPGYDVVNGDSDPSDDNGHGTAVAGIIAARTNNSLGVAGICWICSILPIKVLGADGTGDTSQVAAGIIRAADAGARVIAMSLGGPGTDETLNGAVEYALRKGSIIVAASGNNGVSVPFYPAASPGVLSVAATDQGDRLYSWSNFGGWVQVAAPGCNAAPAPLGGYVLFCGTSSATPLVAGLVALQVSARPDAARGDVIDAVQKTAVPIGDVVSRGRVNAPAALSALAPAAPPAAAPATTTTSTFRGLLTPRTPLRSYRVSVGAGQLTAKLTFGGPRTLTLTMRDSRGAVIVRRAGPSPLRVVNQAAAGTFSVIVSGSRTTATFTLVISAPAAR